MDIKVTIVGETEVGKTSLVEFFVNGNASAHTATTPCASFLRRSMKIDNQMTHFALWDTAGQERFRSIAPMYYRGSDYILIVYDTAYDPSYKEALRFWVGEVKEKCQNQNTQIALVGNKCDLQSQVGVEAAAAEAQRLGIQHFLTSGRTGQGVVEMFTEIAKSVRDGRLKKHVDLPVKEKLVDKNVTKQEQGCCMQ